MRGLIVEDNSIFREAFKKALQERLSFVVIEEAEDGEKALEKIKEAPPDLIFVDIRLVGMNGLELVQKIKKEFSRIRIVMLTGYDFSEYRRAASKYGADRFMVKDSLDWQEIKQFVQDIPKNRWNS